MLTVGFSIRSLPKNTGFRTRRRSHCVLVTVTYNVTDTIQNDCRSVGKLNVPDRNFIYSPYKGFRILVNVDNVRTIKETGQIW